MALRFASLFSAAAFFLTSSFSFADQVATPRPVVVGQQVFLDPSDGLAVRSSQQLVPSWSWVSRPAMSVATFSDAGVLRPGVTVDVPGNYVAKLALRAVGADPASAPLYSTTLEFGTGNLHPVAQLEARGLPGSNRALVLDGSGSYDVDGDLLSYQWSLTSKPAGSALNMSAASSAMVDFTPDVAGVYQVSLKVTDAQGNASRAAQYSVSHFPGETAKNQYLPFYDRAISIDANAASQTINLGDLSAKGENIVIDGFRIHRLSQVAAGTPADSISFVHRGTEHRLSSGLSFLSFIAYLEHDLNLHSNARISPNKLVRDLTFEFDGGHGSITFRNIMGPDCDRVTVLLKGADYYEGFTGETKPEAGFGFDQFVGKVGQPLELDPFASVDIDGAGLSSDMAVVVRPAGSKLSAKVENSRLSVTPDVAGDYLVSLNVADGLFNDAAGLIVSAGAQANARPVARISPVLTAKVGGKIALDGTQSYDFDGDLLSYKWALVSRPATSSIGLDQSESPVSAFTPDVAGTYIVQLGVKDARGVSKPVTQVIQVANVLPVANAGADILADEAGLVTLDGSGSRFGAKPAAHWSVVGLIGDMPYPTAASATQFATQLSLTRVYEPLINVLSKQPVYHRWGRHGTACGYDARQPADLGGEHSIITLWPLGKFFDTSGKVKFVWSIKNAGQANKKVDLVDFSGGQHGSYVVPGNTSLLVALDSIEWRSLKAKVNGWTAGFGWQSHVGFRRDVEVCTGPADTVAQFIVADAHGISKPDTVYVGTGNVRPILKRGAQITVVGPKAVKLNAADYGFDANSDKLSYTWSLLHRPQSSAAALAAQVVKGAQLTFQPDRSGFYLLQATATDSKLDARPVVIVLEVRNSPPTAVAAAIADVFVGETAVLNGSGSSDPEQDALTYKWTVTQRPAGSVATITDPSAAITNFSPDKRGTYTFSLVVSDYEFSSKPATAVLNVPNRAPIAELKGPTEVEAGVETTYSTLGSKDPDNDDLTYAFSVVSKPSGASPLFVDLGNNKAGFVAKTPGDYKLQVSVSDGLLAATKTLDVTVKAKNSPPVLGPINTSYTVELGLEFALDLVGSDPDGDKISFFATPLPLATGISLEAETGKVRFRPEAGQIGSYSFKVGVSDGTLTDEAVLNIKVVAANFGDTAIYGRVLDADDFAKGKITPLAGMPVKLKNAALMAKTKADGTFNFGSLTAGSDLVQIEPSATGGPGGYLATLRKVTITENQNRDLNPDFLLVRLDDGCSAVTAGQATILSNAVSGVKVTVPADSVKDAAGKAYAGQICLGSLPNLFKHPGFDDDTQACRIYALDAPGAVFTKPISIVGPNLDKLPETTELELWRVSELSGKFRRTAKAGVDTGGATVSALLQNTSSSSLFTFLPQAPRTKASADQPRGVRSLTPFEGDNASTYVLPGYTAFGQQQQVALTYHSQAANPTVIVAGDVSIDQKASLPVTLSSRLEIGGLNIADANKWTPRKSIKGKTPALVGEAVTLRQSMPLDGSGLTSGRYDARFTAQAKYDCSTVSASHNAEIYVQNETKSPYGAGWSIDGLQKLVVNPDGSVAVVDDDTVVPFDPVNDFTAFDSKPLILKGDGVIDTDVGDFDGNGKLDIIFGTSGDGAINLALNQGGRDIALSSSTQVSNPINIPQTGPFTPNLQALAAVDFAGDGILDVIHSSQRQDKLGVATGDGFGNFSNQKIADGEPSNLVVVDIDGDGHLDIIVPELKGFFSYWTNLTIYFGKPSGGFEKKLIFYAMQRGRARNIADLQTEVADVDANGHLDIAIRTRWGVNFIYNEGGRNFTLKNAWLGEDGEYLLGEFVQFADLDGDGKLDMIWSALNRLDFFRNNGNRTFASAVPITRPAIPSDAASIALYDVNKDEKMDLLVSGKNELFVLPGKGDGTFEPAIKNVLNHPIDTLIVADVDGDGGLDLISSQRFSVTVDFSKPSNNGKYVAGNGDFSTLTKLAGGGWERRYKNGSIVRFDASGRQVAEVDTYGQSIKFDYDAKGRLISKTDQVGGKTVFAYAANGLLETITYPDGRVTKFKYSKQAQLEKVEDPIGSKVSFKYDENNRLVSTTNQNGNATLYKYDGVGHLSGATLPDGSNVNNKVASSLGLVNGLGGLAKQPLVYVAPEDRVTIVTDRKGKKTEVVVNPFGAIIQTTDPLGRVTRMERNSKNLITRLERPSDAAPGGKRIDTIVYDDFANVMRMTEAVGTAAERETIYTYETKFNKVVSMKDGDGFTTSYEYDASGSLLRALDPFGKSEEKTYTAEGKLATRTDKNGNKTAFTYDGRKNLESVTYADGSVTRMTYDPKGNTTKIAEAAGTPIERQVQRTYDAMNRVLTVEVTGANGAQIDGLTKYTYLPAGNLATVTDETGLVTSMSYDKLERLVTLKDPAEGLIRRTYNAAGEVTEYTNGDNETHKYAYDTVSRLTQTTDPKGYVKAFTYDSRDNVKTVKDGGGGVTTFGYDPLDRLLTRTNPINQTMKRTYDARGNLKTLTREDGTVETASYDGLSRRTKVVTPDNTLTYGYDARGNLTLAADNDSKVTFTYDNRNRLETTTTDGTVGPQPQVTLSYTYDALDRRLTMSDSLGGTTRYAYDVEDRLTKLTAPWGTAYSFGYDGEGRRTSLTSTSGRNSTYGYTNGLLSALKHVQSGVTLTDMAYDYGPDGQLKAILDRVDPAKSRFISYDDLNRLVQVSKGVPPASGGVPVPVEDYAYDEEGNRTSSHLSATYSSNDHNQLLEDAKYTYGYDVKGNRISRTAKVGGKVETYTYDSQNRLVGYTDGTTVASYAYDAMERRIAKTVDGKKTGYVYDVSMDEPLAHDDIVMEFEGQILKRRWMHSNAVDEPIGFEEYVNTSGVGSGNERAIYADRQGSVVWVTDPVSGSVVAAYEYDGYGQIKQTVGTLKQPYGYTGREYDAESGLYHYRARSYDPAAGLFVQSDPIAFQGGQFSLYDYVASNPFGATDPEGLVATTGYSRGSAMELAGSLNQNSYIFAGFAAVAGTSANFLLKLDFFSAGIDPSSIPQDKGICDSQTVAWFDKMKSHVQGECKSGKEAIGANLILMQTIQQEIWVRTLELAMCWDGGLRGDEGHPNRISILFSRQKKCKKKIFAAMAPVNKKKR